MIQGYDATMDLDCQTCAGADRDESIKALEQEAARAGDGEQARLCREALAGDEIARKVCQEVIYEAHEAH